MKRKYSRNFVDSNLSKHLYCPICQEVLYKPSRASCGHTFCKPCIVLWTNKHSNCPLCRKKIKTHDFEKDLIPSLIIDDLIVQCPNKECKWKDKQEMLAQHLKICNYQQAKKEDNQLNVPIIIIQDDDEDVVIKKEKVEYRHFNNQRQDCFQMNNHRHNYTVNTNEYFHDFSYQQYHQIQFQQMYRNCTDNYYSLPEQRSYNLGIAYLNNDIINNYAIPEIQQGNKIIRITQ